MSKVASLVEKFHSVQGEGYNAGRAALFIRFAGCNLDCVFADGAVCDTPWQKAREKLRVDELVEWCLDTSGYRESPEGDGFWRAPMIVFTGGEPTLSPAMPELVERLRPWFYLAIETNGTNWRPYLRRLDWVVVSPKDDIDHANPAGSPEVDSRVMDLPAHEYRYVITGRWDTKPPYYPAKRHYVSPALEADGSGLEASQGITPDFVDGAVERCIEIVQEDPRWRISTQVHKWLTVR